MIKFKFYQDCCGPALRKHHLPDSKYLPTIFTLADIKPGMFSPSVMKRLRSAKKDGSKIVVKTGRRNGNGWVNYSWEFGLQVINEEDRKLQQAKINKLKSEIIKLSKTQEVQLFFELAKKLRGLDNEFINRLLSDVNRQ